MTAKGIFFLIINSDLNLENVLIFEISKDKKTDFSDSKIFLHNLLYIFVPDFIYFFFWSRNMYFVSVTHCDSVYATYIFSPMHLICLFIFAKYINLPVIAYFAPLLEKYTYLPYKWIHYLSDREDLSFLSFIDNGVISFNIRHVWRLLFLTVSDISEEILPIKVPFVQVRRLFINCTEGPSLHSRRNLPSF